MKRRKKRRKSSSSSGKWPRTANETTDNENRPVDGSDNNRSASYNHKDEDNTEHGDDTGKIYSASYRPAHFVIIVIVQMIGNTYVSFNFVFNIYLK